MRNQRREIYDSHRLLWKISNFFKYRIFVILIKIISKLIQARNVTRKNLRDLHVEKGIRVFVSTAFECLLKTKINKTQFINWQQIIVNAIEVSRQHRTLQLHQLWLHVVRLSDLGQVLHTQIDVFKCYSNEWWRAVSLSHIHRVNLTRWLTVRL